MIYSKPYNFSRELLGFLALYIIGIVTTYYLSSLLNQVFFLLIVYLFYKSEKDYFWFAYFLFLVDPPGGLFPMNDYNYGLAMYNLLPGTGRLIYFQELFILTGLYKALKLGRRPKFVFKKSLILLILYLVPLFVFSFLYGMSAFRALSTIRNIIPWSLLFTFLALMPEQEDWARFFRIIFILVIISVGTQILAILISRTPAVLLGIDYQPVMDYGFSYSSGTVNPSELRPISSPHISLLAMLGAMFFILHKDNKFNKTGLFFIILAAYFSILVTGTRGWILSYSLVIAIFIILRGNNANWLFRYGIIVLLLGGLFLISPKIRDHLANSLRRTSTVEKVLEGDLSAGGTDARLASYSPKVLLKFSESPIIGLGFSNEYAKNANGHVGNQNLLMNVGIIGYILFLYFWFSLCYRPLVIRKSLLLINPYRKSLIIIPLVFMGYFIIHSTSGQLFQYAIGYYYSGVSQMLFFAFANFSIVTAKRFDFEVRSKTTKIIRGK